MPTIRLSPVLRSLVRRRRFSLTTIAVVGPGLGAGAASLALISQLLANAPVGIVNPSELVRFASVGTYPDFVRLQGALAAASVATAGRTPLTNEVSAECVTTNYFGVLGIVPSVGRLFRHEDESAPSPALAVITSELWRREFGDNPEAIGRVTRIGNQPLLVTGVVPPRVTGIGTRRTDVWLLLPQAPTVCSPDGRDILSSTTAQWLTTFGRVTPGKSLAEVQAGVGALVAQRLLPDPGLRGIAGDGISPLYQRQSVNFRDPTIRTALIAGIAVAILVLMSCGNAALLAAVEAMRRRRETVIRRQLGASRRMLSVERAAECCILAIASVSLAVFCRWAMSAAIEAHLPGLQPSRLLTTDADRWLLVLAPAAGLLTAFTLLVISDVPELVGRSPVAWEDRHRNWGLRVILSVQVGVCVWLAVGIGVLSGVIAGLERRTGYRTDHMVVVTDVVNRSRGPTHAERQQALELAAARAPKIAQVRGSALSSSGPLGAVDDAFIIEVSDPTVASAAGMAQMVGVSDEYFDVLGTRLLNGSPFRSPERNGEPIAIVDSSVARQIWGSTNVVGRCLRVGVVACVRITGVSETRRTLVLTEDAAEVFVPLSQSTQYIPDGLHPAALFLRVDESSRIAASKLARSGVLRVPDFPRLVARPIEDLVERQLRLWRAGSAILHIVGSLSLLVVTGAAYTLVALTSRQRRREVAIRIALGATRANVTGLLLKNTIWAVAVGGGFGCLAAIGSVKVFQSYVFSTANIDSAAYLFSALPIVIAAPAGIWPAIRGASWSPLAALREE